MQKKKENIFEQNSKLRKIFPHVKRRGLFEYSSGPTEQRKKEIFVADT